MTEKKNVHANIKKCSWKHLLVAIPNGSIKLKPNQFCIIDSIWCAHKGWQGKEGVGVVAVIWHSFACRRLWGLQIPFSWKEIGTTHPTSWKYGTGWNFITRGKTLAKRHWLIINHFDSLELIVTPHLYCLDSSRALKLPHPLYGLLWKERVVQHQQQTGGNQTSTTQAAKAVDQRLVSSR